MKNMNKKIVASISGLAIAGLLLTGCYTKSEELAAREEAQSQSRTDSLGRQNQEERLKREEDPNQIRYVYVFAPLDGSVIGYYTIQGKVSSSGTQNAPEEDLIKVYENSSDRIVMDSSKDDGTFGPSETGSFFFTTEGVLIEIEDLPYLQSDAPIKVYVDAPLFNE